MTTLGDRLDAHRGIGPGFDFLRVALATGVVAWHVDPVLTGVGGRLDHLSPVWIVGYAILTMFFAVSGFLVAGSAGRLGTGDFLLNRGLRMFPALLAEVVLSAFLLGPLLTSLPLAEYLSSGRTWHYLTNVVGLINYELPGVFAGNPTRWVVNVSLWTIPYELLCYGLLAFFMALGLLRRPGLILLGTLFMAAVGLALMALGVAVDAPDLGHKLLSRFFSDHQARLLLAFLVGVLMFVWRRRIPYSPALLLLSLAVCAVIALLGPGERIGYPVVNLLATPALVYVTAFLGVTKLPRLPLFHRGDYSYGIYLYGFPVQQVAMSLFPEVRSELGQFLLAFPVIVLFAMFSWHHIEKPVLRLRKRSFFVSRVRLPKGEDRPGSGVLGAVPPVLPSRS